ncbi:MAG: hypothetical protein KAJ34_02710 [Thermodesulfovibrionia bacterium]|nr:hypothetical protein [Thermodesulfovibrionia bacterium]
MLIKIMYDNNEHDMVKPFLLDKLIISGKIKKFARSKQWAIVGKDKVRGEGGGYEGPERRFSGRDVSTDMTIDLKTLSPDIKNWLGEEPGRTVGRFFIYAMAGLFVILALLLIQTIAIDLFY